MVRRSWSGWLVLVLALCAWAPVAAHAQTPIPQGEPEPVPALSDSPYVAPFGGTTADSAGTDSLRSAGIDYLWVLRNSLVRRQDVPLIVERAKRMGVRGLLVQVVGRGDAYFRSDQLPYPEAIREAGRDPLGELVPLAKAAGLEVHAWVNGTSSPSGSRPASRIASG